MRTILTTLLLLLCLSVSGQAWDSRDTIWFGGKVVHLGQINTDTIIIHPMTYENLVSLWDQYERECWNDSIVEGYEYTWNTEYYSDGHVSSCNYFKCYIICFKYPDYDCQKAVYPQDFKSHFGFDYDTYNPIIDHLKPDPGRGFIEFIRKKYGI
jgi:hypothetical protein